MLSFALIGYQIIFKAVKLRDPLKFPQTIFFFLLCFRTSYLLLNWQLIITTLLAGNCLLFIEHTVCLLLTVLYSFWIC